MANTRRMNGARRTFAGLTVVAALAGAFAVTGIASAAPRARGASADVLAERMRGEAAINALADRLPQVAADNDLTAAEFARQLRTQSELWVSPSGRLLYVDEGLADQADAHDEVEAPEAATDPSYGSYTPAQAFELHSRPGSQRVIYLDFDGHTTPGSGWSGTPGPAYDTDSNPGSFSDGERGVIIDVWRHVSEDFAPFDVNVTTQDPGVDAIRRTTSADMLYGTRVVITPVKTDCSSCGGIAYINNYSTYGGSEGSWTHDKYQPAWVYVAGTSAKNIAEAASHEAGHTLSLHHDGTSSTDYFSGHGSWAPIMGTGYYKSVTQWSRGEYSGANQTEDDVAMIAARTGSPIDDHGNAAGAATEITGTSFSLYGLISTRTDVDAFSVNHGGGTMTIDAKPAPIGPNLDVSLSVLDASGRVLASADPAGLAANLQPSLPAGTYTVLVDGAGAGSASTDGYSDYGSLGRYLLSGTLGGTTTVTNQAPVASATASTTSGPAPLSVTFSSSGSSDSDGSIVGYSWSFGDGTSSTSANPTKSYSSAGSYSAILTVTDDDGAKATSSPITITVTAPDTPAVSAPTAPTLAVPSVSSGSVALSWTQADSATSYVVYRESQHRSGSWRRSQVGTTDGATSYTDSPGSGTFRYQVEARNAGGGASSNVREVTVTSTRTKTTGKDRTGKGAVNQM